MDLVAVKRPGFGTLGRPIKLYANHFGIEIPKQGHFYHYDVEIEILRDDAEAADDDGQNKTQQSKVPEKKSAQKPGGGDPGADGKKSKKDKVSGRTSKDLKRKVMKGFVRANPDGILNNSIPAFDGEKNLYSMRELKLARGESKSVIIKLEKDPDGNAKYVRVTIKPCQPLMTSWSMLSQVMEGKSNAMPVDIFQCINTVFREAALATEGRIAAGRSFFWRDQNSVKSIGEGREIWPGFYSSARPCQWKITLNLDVANTAFYETQDVLTFMAKVLNAEPLALSDGQRKQLEREIKGVKVEMKHSGNIRRSRVTRVSQRPASQQTFLHEGSQVTVADYFFKQYKVKLRFPNLPCLEVGQNGSFIPIELCTVVPGQKVQKKLSDKQTAEMVRYCAQPAPDRKRRVDHIRSTIMKYEESPHLKEFGIKVDGQMMQVDGRILPKPVMGQGHATDDKQVVEITVQDRDGTWEGRNVRFTEPKNLDHWVVICLADPKRIPLDQFLDELKSCGRAKGMRIAEPDPCPRVDLREPDFHGIVKQLMESYKKKNQHLDLIMFILRDRSSQYAEIKKAGDVALGVPTQVVLGNNIFKNAQRGMGQLVGNILLKINAKLGGINSQVANLNRTTKAFSGLLQRFIEVPTIVFGADVTHPSPGESSSRPSIAAVVASFNRSFTSYSARVRAQGHRAEIMSGLRDMVKELFIEFKNRVKVEPKRILFYRDGVSEGQFRQVMMEELHAIQQACLALAPDGSYKPPITYIIVGKRHHTRLFAANLAESAGKAQNVPPGTITDKTICHFSEFDWYLCSHAGIQGTSRPAHYNVLYDDTGFKADEIQLFSYYLTYCYSRCNRSVSIPAPAYYAHHVAFRARAHLEDRLNDVESSVSSGESISQSKLEDFNKKIKVHENIKGMYFA